MNVYHTLSLGPKGSFVLIDFSIVIVAAFTNCIVLAGIIKGNFKLAGYKRFLLSLCIGDLYMSCLNFIILIYDAATHYRSKNDVFFHFFRGLQLIGFFANLFNLCGVSGDHFIGIIYPHKYRYLSKKFLARYAAVYLWIFAIILGLSDIPKAMVTYLNNGGIVVSDSAILKGQQSNSHPFTALNSKHANTGPYSSEEDAECAEAINLFANAVSGADPNSFKELYELISTYLSDQDNLSTLKVMTSSPIKTTESPLKTVFYHQQRTRSPRKAASATVFPNSNNLLLTSRKVPVLMTDVVTLSQTRMLPSLSPSISPSSLSTTSRLCFTGNMSRTEKAFDEAFNSKRLHDLQRFNSDSNLEYIVIVVCFLCFLFLIVCYGIIFRKILQIKNFPNQQRDQPTAKLIATSCLFVGSFVICWLPFITFEILLIILTQFANLSAVTWTSLYHLHEIFMSILMSYPLCDSVIYGVRVPAIRKLILSKFTQRASAGSDAYFGAANNSGGELSFAILRRNHRGNNEHQIAAAKRLVFMRRCTSQQPSVDMSQACSLVLAQSLPKNAEEDLV